MYKKDLNTRLSIITVIFLSCLTLLFFRLAKIQLINRDYLSRIAAGQHDLTIKLLPERGAIFDRKKKRLAFSTKVDSVYAMTKEVADKDFAAHKLASVLNKGKPEILKTLQSRAGFVWLERHVPKEIGEAAINLKLNGIGIFEEAKRVYPNNPLANQLIGFTDIDSNGIEGIELAYDDYLKGVPGWLKTERDARLRPIKSFQKKIIPAVDGHNLVLSIDEVIQYIAEREIDEAYRKHKAAGGIVIVMAPKTGDILALANRPLDARNFAVTDAFEPGSCFKIVTAAAALEEKQVSLEDTFFCENGVFKFGSRILHDYRPHGDLTFQQVIEKSSNIGTVKVATQLGQEMLYKYTKAFGFGETTGSDLPGEVNGILRPIDKWSSFSITSVPIGQEVAVTPIQLARAISTVANDGVMMRPRVVLQVEDKSGRAIKEFEPVIQGQVFSKGTAVKLKQILAGVVENGSGTNAKVKGYRVAGKTGTAQKADKNGRYSSTKYVSSFIGFVPAENPVISIVVMLDEPRPLHLGGTVAAPVFRNIARDVLYYLEVLPDSNLIAKN